VDTARAVTMSMYPRRHRSRPTGGRRGVRVARLRVCSTSPDPGSVRDADRATSPRSFDARLIPAIYIVFAGAADVVPTCALKGERRDGGMQEIGGAFPLLEGKRPFWRG
jgi:hypothetical protein